MKRVLWFVVAVASAQISPEKEALIGQRLSASIEQQYPVLDDARVAQYVTTLAERIARRPVSIKVLADDGRLATALPGGLVYVSAGLIARSEHERAFALTLAHSVAHGASGPIAKTGSVIFWHSFCAKFSDGVATVPLALRSEQQDRESESDRLGAEYLSQAGDLGNGAEFNEVKQSILSRHPPRTKPTLYRKRG